MAERPPSAVRGPTGNWWRFARTYALDLAVSLLLLLLGAWSLGIAGQPQSAWLIDLQTAFGRFAPTGVWHTYSDQVQTAVDSLAYTPGKLVLSNMLFGLRLVWCILLAVPDTLMAIVQQTETASDWMTLIGFGVVLVTTFAIMLTARRVSLPHVVQVVVVTPIVAISLFWLVQQTVLSVIYAFSCYAVVAPWCLLCPFACTLYWMAFPDAEHGATVSSLLALSRIRVRRARKQQNRRTDRISTTTRTRKSGA